LSTLCSAGVFAISLKFFGYVSLSSILAAISLPLLGIFFKMPLSYIYLSTIVALFTLQKHRDNIVRLTQGTEANFFKK
jgi:glycerol-3-phosphate acyltransferase PlsY